MTSATSANLALLQRESPGVFRLLVGFNYHPAGYLHPSRRPTFSGGAMSASVWNEARAARFLSAHILEELALENNPCFDPALKEWPIALLDTTRMLRLARHAGAIVIGARIRGSIARDAVLHWKSVLTPEVYKFVMTGTSLFPAFDFGPLPDESVTVESIGYSLIEDSLTGAPEALFERATLKFPAERIITLLAREKAQQMIHSVLVALEAKWCSSFVLPRL